jgi:cob(I)alamin adenosyltransferase
MIKYYTQKVRVSGQSGYNPGMSRIYTRSGDNGTTGLLGEGRLPKFHPRMETLGALDEASAALGLARAQSLHPRTGDLLRETQRDLYAIMTEVAATPENAQRFQALEMKRVEWLEAQIDSLSAMVPMPGEFILPGDSLCGASLALARTIVRRAERRVAELFDTGEIQNKVLLPYLNRLSSLCFVLELQENAQAGKSTTLAKEK